MSNGITLCCPRCGNYSALHKEYDEFKSIDVYTCQKEDCGRRFAIEMVIKKKTTKMEKARKEKGE